MSFLAKRSGEGNVSEEMGHFARKSILLYEEGIISAKEEKENFGDGKGTDSAEEERERVLGTKPRGLEGVGFTRGRQLALQSDFSSRKT